MCGLKITLSSSEKSLKEQIVAFIEKIKDELDIIETIDNKIEVLTEYKQNLDLKKSIVTVCERKERVAEELKREQQRVEQKNEQLQTAQTLEEISVPTVIEEDNMEQLGDILDRKLYEMTFTVKGTMEQLKALKEYLKKESLINE